MSGAAESSDLINSARHSLNISQLLKYGDRDKQISPENISEWCGNQNNVTIKTWISLSGASSLTFIVCRIHSLELTGLDNICVSTGLILCSYCSAMIGIALILLAVLFKQMIGYALLFSILVPSISGCMISAYLWKELKATSKSIQKLYDLLKEMKEIDIVPDEDAATLETGGGGDGPANAATTSAAVAVPLALRPSLPLNQWSQHQDS